MNTHGNRGMTFESLIENANERYRLDRRAVVGKQHTLCKPLRDAEGRIAGAKYGGKATVDFVGRIGGRPVAFEAKDSNAGSIALKRVEEHQCAFLDDWTKDPASVGFVLVSFRLLRFFVIPWEYWKAAKTARETREPAIVAFPPMRTPWDLTCRASVKEDELPAEWEARLGGRAGIGVDWLEAVTRLWGDI